MKDDLGDRMKEYEKWSTESVIQKGTPFIARLDGRAFHSWTKGCKRPFDEDVTQVMTLTSEKLLKEFGANIAYTQSDEISLLFYIPEGSTSEYVFGGRRQKLESMMSAVASVEFNNQAKRTRSLAHKQDGFFDCRVFPVPSLDEAINNLIWRQYDCVKNAITLAAYSKYSHKECLNKHSGEKLEMLQAKGVNFEDYPGFFKYGTILRNEQVELTLDDAKLQQIPKAHRPTGPVIRHIVRTYYFMMDKYPNFKDFVLNGKS